MNMEEREYHSLRAAEDRHWWFVSTQKHVVRCVRSATRRTPLQVLDAGCGTGGLASRLRRLGTVRCIDASPIAVEYTRARGLEHVNCSELMTAELEDNSLDAITSVDVLYHAGVKDPQAVATRLGRALRPGGVLVLHLPAFEIFRGPHDQRVHTRKRFRRSEVRELLANAGLDVRHVSYRVTALLPLILVWRWVQRKSPTSDIRTPVAPINRLLLWIADIENRISTVLPLPFGLSVYAIARKADER